MAGAGHSPRNISAMIESKDIKAMVTHVLQRQRGVPDRESINPAREWILGVVATVILVMIGGLISYGFYLNTISLEVDTNHVPAVAIPYNASLVEATVIEFRARTTAYDRIRGAEIKSDIVPGVAATTSEATATNTPTEIEPTENSENTELVPEVVEPTESAEDKEEVVPVLGV